jgi:aminoglycoside phosphotransferase (APT) family kinase protein
MEIDQLKLLAQGGQAEIYEMDQNKVIRVLRKKEDEESLKYEMKIMQSLKDKGKTVPTIYEYLQIDGRPAIIMERLYGATMLEDIKRKPLHIFRQAKKLASLHMEVADTAKGLRLQSIHDRAAHLIPKAELLELELKEFVLSLLTELPREDRICHGDFHPGNIIISNNNYYVIDWFGVTSGDVLSDIAHTYLILRNTPKIPGISRTQNLMIDGFASILSKKYLTSCDKLCTIDYSKLSKWLVVRAAERVFYGMPTEKDALIKFIKACKKSHLEGKNPNTWWKLI